MHRSVRLYDAQVSAERQTCRGALRQLWSVSYTNRNYYLPCQDRPGCRISQESNQRRRVDSRRTVAARIAWSRTAQGRVALILLGQHLENKVNMRLSKEDLFYGLNILIMCVSLRQIKALKI